MLQRAVLYRNLKCQVHESGKLEVVKQEMERVNINILGISKLKLLEWVNLTQITIISTTVGRNPLEEWSSYYNQEKSLKCSTRMQSPK